MSFPPLEELLQGELDAIYRLKDKILSRVEARIVIDPREAKAREWNLPLYRDVLDA